MSATQELSKFYSNDSKRTATIFRLLGMDKKKFSVSAVNESGSSFTALFETALDAENFAEDWVLQR
jgi:hypothetical protein